MGRRDTRPEPPGAAWRIHIGVEPLFWDNARRSRGCGYIFTRVYLVGDGWDCGSAAAQADDLAAHLRELYPTDLALSILRVTAPGDPFRRCGEDVPCQSRYFPIRAGHAPREGGKHDSFMTWTLSGWHYDPTGATRAGFTRIVVPTSAAYPPVPGRRHYGIMEYPRWAAFRDYLNGSETLFADRWGRKCDTDIIVTLHRSSFYQKA